MPQGKYKITMVDDPQMFIESCFSNDMGNVHRSLLRLYPEFSIATEGVIDRNPADRYGQRIFGDVFDPDDLNRPADTTTDGIEMRLHNMGGNLPMWVIADMTTLIERVNQLERSV